MQNKKIPISFYLLLTVNTNIANPTIPVDREMEMFNILKFPNISRRYELLNN